MNDYTYLLPDEMIARFPLANRAEAKLLVYDRGKVSHTNFKNIGRFSGGGGLMIFNNTRVIQARILMYKDTGARIEIFLLEPLFPAGYDLAFSSSPGCRWKCMVGNKKRWRGGKLSGRLIIDREKTTLYAGIVGDHGSWQEIEFTWEPANEHFGRVIDHAGLTPIPPYLNRMPVESDKTDYQTVYSKFEGSVAAPTAGLHFTPEILEELNKSGTLIGEITLHVGAGTFQPVRTETAGEHPMHAEYFSVDRETIGLIRDNPGKITAVGTTSVRTLESLYWLGVKQDRQGFELPRRGKGGKVPAGSPASPVLLSQWEYLGLPSDIPSGQALDALIGKIDKEGLNRLEAKTELMITPGYRFRITDKLITNFHQPGSTLLLLIAAFTGGDWRKVYDYALRNNFRFLSYGDGSLLIPANSGSHIPYSP